MKNRTAYAPYKTMQAYEKNDKGAGVVGRRRVGDRYADTAATVSR